MSLINVASVLSVMLDSAVRRHGPEHGQRLNESERDLADMLEGKCTAAHHYLMSSYASHHQSTSVGCYGEQCGGADADLRRLS